MNRFRMKASTINSIVPCILVLSLVFSDGFAPRTAATNDRGQLLLQRASQQQDQFWGGLTDDGDFLLVGINGEDPLGSDNEKNEQSPPSPSPSLSSSSSYVSSLDLGSSDAVSDSASSTTGSSKSAGADQSTTPKREDNNGEDHFWELNQDGDFLITGINGNDPLQGGDENEGSSSLVSSPSSPSLGLKLTSADDSIDMSVVARFKEAVDARSSTSDSIVASNVDESDDDADEGAVGSVEEWLLQIIPTLQETDSTRYARKLVAIGFDPGCVTQCELTWDDLEFMKSLHRRYLYNEITGQGHPWEA